MRCRSCADPLFPEGGLLMKKTVALNALLLIGFAGCGPVETSTSQSEAEVRGGQFCGGIAGFPCPDGYVCVDDPRDSCDPRRGGADCCGICKKRGKPPQCPNDPTLH